MTEIAFSCSADFTISSMLEEAVEAILDIIGDNFSANYGERFYVPFEYTIGRPSVTNSPFRVKFQQINFTPENMSVALPTVESISPAAPILTNVGPEERRNGIIDVQAPNNPNSESSGSEEEALEYRITITMYQPDADGYGTTIVSANSPLSASYTESNNYVKVILDVEDIAGITPEIETQLEEIEGDDGVLYSSDLWAETVGDTIIDYDYLENLLEREIEPTENLSVTIKARGCISIDDEDFDAARAIIDSRWPGGATSSRRYCFGLIPIAFNFPTRTSAPGRPTNLRGTVSEDGNSITFSWDKPGYLGRSFLKEYEYRLRDDTHSLIALTSNAKSTTVTIDATTLGSDGDELEANFRVRAVNGADKKSGFTETTVTFTIGG